MPLYVNGRIGNGGWNPTFVKAIGLLFSEDENASQDLRDLYEEAVTANKTVGTSRSFKKSESFAKNKVVDDEKKKNKGNLQKGTASDISRDIEKPALKKEPKFEASTSDVAVVKKSETVIISGTSSTGDRKRPKYTDIDMFASLSSSKSSSASSSKKQKKSSTGGSKNVVATSGTSSSVPVIKESSGSSGAVGTAGGSELEADTAGVKVEPQVVADDSDCEDVDLDTVAEPTGVVAVTTVGVVGDTGSVTGTDITGAAASCLICGNQSSSNGSGPNDIAGNKLLECNECHAYYHQKCHKPAVTDQEVRDPRFLWYCYKCNKQSGKSTSNDQPLGGKTEGSSITKSPSIPKSVNKLGSASGTSTVRGLFAMSNTLTVASGSGNKSSGAVAGASSVSSTKSSSSVQTAEKRLQDMKRRANSKQSEKRKLPAI